MTFNNLWLLNERPRPINNSNESCLPVDLKVDSK